MHRAHFALFLEERQLREERAQPAAGVEGEERHPENPKPNPKREGDKRGEAKKRKKEEKEEKHRKKGKGS